MVNTNGLIFNVGKTINFPISNSYAVSSEPIATNSNLGSTNIGTAVQGHVYSIVGYDAATGRFDIRNPWDTRHLNLTYAQLLQLNAYISRSIA